MASEWSKVKYHGGGMLEGCPCKHSHELVCRTGPNCQSPESETWPHLFLFVGSSSSGSGAGRAASPGFLIASPGRFLKSKGSALHPAHSSLEMASLQKEACKVDYKDSSSLL